MRRGFVFAGCLILFINLYLEGQVTVTFEAEKDNTIFQESGDESAGQGWGLFAGRTASSVQRTVETVVVNSAPTNRRRALIKFDISSIPSSAIITNVEIGLFIDREPPGAQAEIMSFHRLLSDWGEALSAEDNGFGAGLQAQTNDVTWTHRFYNTTEMWSNPGGDYVQTASSSQSVKEIPFESGVPPARTVWTSAGLIADVQDWVKGDNMNFGWIIIGDESKNLTAKRFASKDKPGFFTPRPQLTITYIIPGQEPSASALINEINVYHDWVEIYNPTDDVIDLTTHALCSGSTCDDIGSLTAPVFNGNGMLATGEFTVVQWSQLNDVSGEIVLQAATGALDTSEMVDYMQYGTANQTNADEAVAKGVWSSVTDAITVPSDTTTSLALLYSTDYESGEDTNLMQWESQDESPTLRNGIQTSPVRLSNNLVGAEYNVFDVITVDGTVAGNTEVKLKSSNSIILDVEAQVDSSAVLEATIILDN